jgi:hypothetical protein
MLDPIDIMTEARWRTMYGDGFTHDGPNTYISDSWRGSYVLISAICYLQGTPRYYGQSTAALAVSA